MIGHWFEGADEAWETAKTLMAGKRYLHALFFCHLTLEKTLKGRFIAVQGEAPPLVHDLVWLAEKSNTKFSVDERQQLVKITKFNIAGRYEDYRLRMHQQATPEFAEQLLKQTEELYLKLRQD